MKIPISFLILSICMLGMQMSYAQSTATPYACGSDPVEGTFHLSALTICGVSVIPGIPDDIYDVFVNTELFFQSDYKCIGCPPGFTGCASTYDVDNLPEPDEDEDNDCISWDDKEITFTLTCPVCVYAPPGVPGQPAPDMMRQSDPGSVSQYGMENYSQYNMILGSSPTIYSGSVDLQIITNKTVSLADLVLMDVDGRVVVELPAVSLLPGAKTFSFDTHNLPAANYAIGLRINGVIHPAGKLELL